MFQRSLEQHEWLPVARRLAIGATRRIKHGNESRSNLVVGNRETEYWAWCHACGIGGTVRKEHAKLAPAIQQEPRNPLPQLLHPIEAAPTAVQAILLERGFGHSLQKQIGIAYDPLQRRVYIPISSAGRQFGLGRATQPNQQPKWCEYGEGNTLGFATAGAVSPNVVITEDYFSAAKVNHATGHHCIAALGTRLKVSLQAYLAQHRPEHIVVWADNDAAGAKLAQAVQRFGRAHGIRTIQVNSELDPKDHTYAYIRNVFNMA